MQFYDDARKEGKTEEMEDTRSDDLQAPETQKLDRQLLDNSYISSVVVVVSAVCCLISAMWWPDKKPMLFSSNSAVVSREYPVN